MNFKTVIILITIGCLLIFLLILYILIFKERKKLTVLINNHSIAINNLKCINEKYKFYDLDEKVYNNLYDNEAVYNNISCEDILIYQLQNDKFEVLGDINKAKYNENHYKDYLIDVNDCEKFGNYNVEVKKNKLKKLIRLERKIFKNNIIHPKLKYTIIVIMRSIAINGYIKDTKVESFDKEEIERCIKELNKKEGAFYLNKDYWDAICRVERGKVTNRLRFEIFERDNYTCKCCGRKEEIANLEVDHIMPISKHGKSIPSNLQTLCKDCNLAKGAKYIKYK